VRIVPDLAEFGVRLVISHRLGVEAEFVCQKSQVITLTDNKRLHGRQ
jgi:hypothetical protein